MSLKEYKRKRDFHRTPEPAGSGAAAPGRLFVIQKHDASRLHYDFRLELDGTLKSWAVPKGPSLDPAHKSLAVQVEDHPVDYASFEGVIPQGEYGGGTVMVWDHGTWEPEGDPRKDLRKGKLTFTLHGEKLHGAWSLVRMGGSAGEGGKNWLLIKRSDKEARNKGDILQSKPNSVLSSRGLEQIAADVDHVWHSNGSHKTAAGKKPAAKAAHAKSTKKSPAKRTGKSPASISPKSIAAIPGARKAEMPATLHPQLATLAAKIPPGDDWIHELKFDGYRMLVFMDADGVRLVTRKGNDWTKRFKTIQVALARLKLDSAILDGEIVSLDERGISDFQALQNQLKRGRDDAIVYYLFDVPYLHGFDLTGTPLKNRKELLAKVLTAAGTNNSGPLRFSDHVHGHGGDVLSQACRHALEGIVAKRLDSHYREGRTGAWIKVKCLQRQEFVIGGCTAPSGSRVGFGALLLGYYEKGKLKYAGRVGTGFTRDTLRQVYPELKSRLVASSPFSNPPRGAMARDVRWVRPELVGEVEFTEWTDDGRLRHPSFQGLREDKPAKEIVREVPSEKPARATSEPDAMPKKPRESKAPPSGRQRPPRRHGKQEAEAAGVRITHPDRVVFPEQKLTKLDVAEFYVGIADWILPHVAGRPLSLVRCPDGLSGQCFYQKHLAHELPGVKKVTITEKTSKGDYAVVEDVRGLVSLVQMGVLEIHPWASRADRLEKPDRVVFDLDPAPGVEWHDVVESARELRRRLEAIDLESFVRTSGGKGLHVVLPLQPGCTWEKLKSFAKETADSMAADEPEKYLAVATKAKRKGKIFIDYLRNSRGATAVASYSTRARPSAPVATPLTWDELGSVGSADRYNAANLGRRLSALKGDPWKKFFKLRQTL